MTNQLPTAHVLQRICGVRLGTAAQIIQTPNGTQIKDASGPGYYLAGEVTPQDIIDPVVPISREEMEYMKICAQGQSLVYMQATDGTEVPVLYDVVGDNYSPYSFAVEAFRKGTSNKMGVLGEGDFQRWAKNNFNKLATGMEVFYIHKSAYIEPDSRKYFYGRRLFKFLQTRKDCPLDIPDHQTAVLPDQYGQFPMCWHLLAEDGACEPGDTMVKDHIVMKGASVNMKYLMGITPKGKIERSHGIFLRARLSRVEIIVTDDQKNADMIADALNGVGLNIPFVGLTQ